MEQEVGFACFFAIEEPISYLLKTTSLLANCCGPGGGSLALTKKKGLPKSCLSNLVTAFTE